MRGKKFATHGTAPTLGILVIHNGDHDFSSGGDIDLGPFKLVGIMDTKVDTESEFRQVGKHSEAKSTGVTYRASPHGLSERTIMIS